MPSGDLAVGGAARSARSAVRHVRARWERPEIVGGGALALGLLLWAVSIGTIDAREMSDLGLVSTLPAAAVAGFGILTVSFVSLALRRPGCTGLIVGHVAALVAMLHATPPLVYDTLRYSWAWKHLGIVDYIQRHGSVNPDVSSLEIYHSWPGFFVAVAQLQDLAGLGDLIGVATWAPVAFTALGVAALMLAVSALTSDRRVLWLTAWTFVLANWVGQEYFSPQAFAFVLYLTVLAIALRWLRPPGGVAPGRLPRWLGRGLACEPAPPAGRALPGAGRAAVLALVVVLMAAIVSSHALTSMMIVLALGALVLARSLAVRSLPLIAAAMAVVWVLTFARDYVVTNVGATLSSVSAPWTTTESNLAETAALSSDQVAIATISRGLTVAVVGLAVLGMVRLFRRGALDPAPLALALAPALLFLTGDYDGELIFRIYLFASPFLAYFAVHALPLGAVRRARAIDDADVLAGVVAVVSVLLVGFLFSHFGKDREYAFTSAEVAAAESIYRTAPPGSLLVQGTRNVPVQFLNYENLTYVTLADEAPDTRARVFARPAAVLADWLSDPAYRRGYILITRSQKAEVESLGSLPAGSLQRVERALASSPRFHVVRNRDAMIATLATTGPAARRPSG